jgi:NADP-dependent 3-hydroxy acid dehydrogenase YdfG
MASIDESKCILITGATSGIGRALALDIAKLPSHPVVIGTGRRKERLEELGRAGIHPVELSITSDFDALKNNVDEIVKKYPDVRTGTLSCWMPSLSTINWTAGYGHTQCWCSA